MRVAPQSGQGGLLPVGGNREGTSGLVLENAAADRDVAFVPPSPLLVLLLGKTS